MTGPSEPDDSPERTIENPDLEHRADAAEPDAEAEQESGKKKRGALREFAILVSIALVLYYVMLTFIARPYLIPSESMEPTLHGCNGCVGDRIMVDKLSYRFGSPQPGDVVVFKGPPNWSIGYQSIRSDNTAIRWLQNALAVVGFVPPELDELERWVKKTNEEIQQQMDQEKEFAKSGGATG